MREVALAIDAVRQLFPDAEIRMNERMSQHTSFRIGGPVSVMFLPKSIEELQQICKSIRDFSIRTIVIGNGTNLLVDDKPMEIAVIKIGEGMSRIALTDETVIQAESGAILSKVAAFAMNHALCGFEFAHGIPGSVGGAVCMNAGAYGGEIKDVIRSVTTLSDDGKFYAYSGEECLFSYRQSRFSDGRGIVLSVEIALQKGNREEIKARMDELSARRKNSQPLQMPSAGSTFKRPATGYAAAMIEQAGLKGFGVGGAQVSEKHAGFIINRGGATFEDVLKTMEHVQETIYKKFGVTLIPEVKIIK